MHRYKYIWNAFKINTINVRLPAFQKQIYKKQKLINNKVYTN